MPRMGEDRKALQVRTRVEVHVEQEPPVPADPPGGGPSNLEQDGEENSRGREVERGREVAGVIINLTVGPDGCVGQAIYVGWGGAHQKET